MEIRVLGPFAVTASGRPLDLGRPKQRALLALLVAAGGQVVGVERLVDQLWGDAPPARATASLQAYVSNLRRVLEPDRAPRAPTTTLLSRPPGYALAVDPGAVDGVRFGELLGHGQDLMGTDPARARDRLDEALALWRGEPYGGVTGCALLLAEATRLDELRLLALEDRWQVDIELGGHTRAVAGLERFVADHPWRERAWGQLALALYRGQRQGDALEVLGRARRRLVDELGVAPGPELRRLEAAVLAHDPLLDARVTGSAPARTGSAGDPPARDDDTGTGLVGYVGELRRLTAALPEVTGAGRVALVTGEPGIGKTRITEALAAAGRRRGVRIGVGAWDAEAGSPPLWAWCCAVRGLVGHLDEVELRVLLGDTAADLAPLLSIAGTGPDPGGRHGRLDAESAGFRLGSAVLDLLRVLGAQAPTLLVLDDLHWADPDSLRLLRAVVSGLEGVPALVVGTSREAEADIGPHLAETLAALARHDPLRVRLHGLDAADVAGYVRRRHGTEISAAGARAIRDRTDGNPFYIAELVGLLVAEGTLADAAGAAHRAIPDGVRDIVRARLAQLPDGAERVLAVASVAGRAFDLDLVALASQQPPGQVLHAVEAAVARGIVAEDDAVPDRFRFAHSLLREAVYARIAAPRRALLHAATADALERLRAGRLQDHLAELAGHYSRAGPASARAAWSFASRAGAQAESRAAHEEASRLYGEALAALTLDPFATHRERYELLVRLGGARARTGQPASAWEALESAARDALDAGDVAGAARAVLVVTVDPLWTWRPYPTVDPDAITLVTELLDGLAAGDDALRAQLLAMLAVELLYDAGSGDRCARLADEAVALAADGEPAVLLHVLELSWMALQLRPDLLHRRAALTEERVRVAQLLPDPVATARGLTARSAAHVEQGRLQQGWADLDRAAGIAERHRSAPVAMVIAWAQALRPFVAGDFDTAEREIARLREVHSDVSMSGGGLWLLQLAQLRAAQGRLGELAPALDEWMVAWPALRDLRALATLQSEGVSAARALLGPWPSQPRLVLDYTWTNFMVVRAQVWRALGDVDALRALRADLAPFADRFAYGGTGMMFGGLVGHTLGELALGCGDAEAAVAHLRDALARHRENGCVPHTALSRWALAGALRARRGAIGRNGDDQEARSLAAQARSEALRLGLVLPGPPGRGPVLDTVPAQAPRPP